MKNVFILAIDPIADPEQKLSDQNFEVYTTPGEVIDKLQQKGITIKDSQFAGFFQTNSIARLNNYEFKAIVISKDIN